MYFMLAMLAYIFYNKTREYKYFGLALACFVFSLLAKAQAVSLPLVLLLTDYFMERKPSVKLFLEKIPFFVLSLVFGMIAIQAQYAEKAINTAGLSAISSICYASYSIWVYLFKLILPVNLTCLYEYPYTAEGNIPFYIHLSPVILVVLPIVLWIAWKKHRVTFFGLLFFLAVIFPVLQFLPVGQAIVAERYSYIPYIGLFFIIGFLFASLYDRFKSSANRKTLNYAGIGVILTLCLLTWNRTQVWADSVSLWTDVMEKNPSCMSAYINRSFMYIKYNQYDNAIRDCNDGLKIDPAQFKLYINRGTAYRHMAMYDLALDDFSRAIRQNPQSYDTYADRGVIYTGQLKKYDSGISDFRHYLKFRPDNPKGNINLAVAYYKKQEYDSSIKYLDKTVALDPEGPNGYYIFSLVYAAKQDFAKAYEYGSRAQSLGHSMDQALLEGWRKNGNIVIPVLK
jgi:tetratricopeptide (TPR) repeat protein